jgi:hypothetical protein
MLKKILCCGILMFAATTALAEGLDPNNPFHRHLIELGDKYRDLKARRDYINNATESVRARQTAIKDLKNLLPHLEICFHTLKYAPSSMGHR